MILPFQVEVAAGFLPGAPFLSKLTNKEATASFALQSEKKPAVVVERAQVESYHLRSFSSQMCSQGGYLYFQSKNQIFRKKSGGNLEFFAGNVSGRFESSTLTSKLDGHQITLSSELDIECNEDGSISIADRKNKRLFNISNQSKTLKSLDLAEEAFTYSDRKPLVRYVKNGSKHKDLFFLDPQSGNQLSFRITKGEYQLTSNELQLDETLNSLSAKQMAHSIRQRFHIIRGIFWKDAILYGSAGITPDERPSVPLINPTHAKNKLYYYDLSNKEEKSIPFSEINVKTGSYITYFLPDYVNNKLYFIAELHNRIPFIGDALVSLQEEAGLHSIKDFVYANGTLSLTTEVYQPFKTLGVNFLKKTLDVDDFGEDFVVGFDIHGATISIENDVPNFYIANPRSIYKISTNASVDRSSLIIGGNILAPEETPATKTTLGKIEALEFDSDGNLLIKEKDYPLSILKNGHIVSVDSEITRLNGAYEGSASSRPEITKEFLDMWKNKNNGLEISLADGERYSVTIKDGKTQLTEIDFNYQPEGQSSQMIFAGRLHADLNQSNEEYIVSSLPVLNTTEQALIQSVELFKRNKISGIAERLSAAKPAASISLTTYDPNAPTVFSHPNQALNCPC